MGRTSSPGLGMGTRNAVSPACLGTSGSVRQMARPHGEMRALEVQTFWPSSTQWSPSRVARVARPARSLPAPGSENSWQQNSSARRKRRTKRSFCSGVPKTAIVGATRWVVTANSS